MAAPPEITIHALSGAYELNKTLSDSTTNMLKMQGIGFIVRQAVSYSAIHVNLAQYTDADDDATRTHVDQEQISTGNMKQYEARVLDGEWYEREIQFWGKVKGWNKYTALATFEGDAFLHEGWSVRSRDGEVIVSHTESVSNGWVATQVWGFAEVEGQRRYVRRVYSKKGKEEHRVRLVYDYKGKAEAFDVAGK